MEEKKLTPTRMAKRNIRIRKEDRDELGRIKPGTVNQLRYKTRTKLLKGINAYFDHVAQENLPATLGGLAVHLGVSRSTLVNYEGRYKPELEWARSLIEASLESRLIVGEGSTNGIALALKNGFGWSDKQELQTTNKTLQLQGFQLIPPSDDTTN